MQATCGRWCGDRPSLSVYTGYAAGLKVNPWHCLLLAVSQQGCFVWLANVGNTCSAGSARCRAIKQVLPILTNPTNPLQFSMHAPAQEVEVEVPELCLPLPGHAEEGWLYTTALENMP